jgi:lipid-binding SYLF domain-containing protein
MKRTLSVVVVIALIGLPAFAQKDENDGVMTCRGGKQFNGPWSAPSMMALDGGSFGLQLGGQGDRLRFVGNESTRG